MHERFKTTIPAGSALACLIILFALPAKAETLPVAFEISLARAKAALAIAEKNGGKFANGDKPGMTDAQLFENLKQDPNVWNVIFERSYRNENGRLQDDRRIMDPQKTLIEKLPQEKKEDDAHYSYALANKRTLPLMMVTKIIKGDNEQYGVITVLVLANSDKIFEVVMAPNRIPVQK